MSAIETRAAWMIGTYRNVVLAPSPPNGPTAQKFGWADVLARLALNPADPAPVARFMALLTSTQYRFNESFMPAGAGWILCKHWDRFTPEQRATLVAKLKTISGLLSHGTENHFLIKYVGASLFAQLWPSETGWYDAITKRRMSSAEFGAVVKQRLLVTLSSYFDKAYNEHLSPNYLPVHLYPLHALYNCSTDPELKAAADAVLTYHAADMAANFFHGNTIAPFNRPGPYRNIDPQRNTILNTHLKALYWLYWAELMPVSDTPPMRFPSLNSFEEARHFAVAAAISTWRPPAMLADLAAGAGVPFTLRGSAAGFGEFARGDAAYTERTVYRHQEYAISSGNYTTNINSPVPARGRGLSERIGHQVLLKTSKPLAEITCTHPYWRSAPGQYAWLSRSSPFQQNAQHESTLISLFNIPPADPFKGRTDRTWETYRGPMIQQAWIRWPKGLDEAAQANGWHFLREGSTYVAIRAWGPSELVTGEFPDMTVLRSSGAQNVVVMDVASTAEFPSFAAFRAAVLAAPLSVDLAGPSVSYRNVRGDIITASWGTFNPASQIIESFPRLEVNGQAQSGRSAAVIQSGPISLAGRVLKVKTPTGSLSVDWSGSLPVLS
jgi:hypothetical protein